MAIFDAFAEAKHLLERREPLFPREPVLHAFKNMLALGRVKPLRSRTPQNRDVT